MLMGPVFRSELLRTARRPRYYALRALYGLLLLLVVWGGYARQTWHKETSHRDVAQFAEATFAKFAFIQFATVMLLIPPLFGGSIADEKQRKTLHYLMASQLSGAEIVLDKVLGRLPHLAIFVAIGLPVVSLLRLLGGIPTEALWIVYIGTLSTTAMGVAITVLVSTLARGVKQAVLASVLIIGLWLFVPPFIHLYGSVMFRWAYNPIQPYNDWLASSSPFGIFFKAALRSRGWRSMWGLLASEMAWMVALQLGAAVLLLLIAIWQLRPTFRRQEATPARRTWFKRRSERKPRWLVRPSCGVDPVLWKERYFAPTDVFTRLILLPAIIAMTLPLALLTLVEWGITDMFLRILRVDLGWYIAFWLLAVAGASASGVTTEREADTWITLTSTPLTGWEILRAKVLGAIWNQRGFAAVLVFLWLLGLVTGEVHPLGVLCSMALVGLLTWMVAAVGTYYSLQASSTSKAIGSTIIALFFLNAYPVILALLFFEGLNWNDSYSLLGAMPRLAIGPIVSPAFGANVLSVLRSGPFNLFLLADNRGVGLNLLAIYFGAALFYTCRVVRRFDTWLDRPELTRAAAKGAVSV